MGIVKIILGGSNYFKALQKCSTVWFLFTSARRQLRSEQSLWMVCWNRISCVINAGYCGFDYRFICSGKPFANCFISTLFLTTPHLEKEAKKKKKTNEAFVKSKLSRPPWQDGKVHWLGPFSKPVGAISPLQSPTHTFSVEQIWAHS